MKTSGSARAHRLVESQAAPLGIDPPALADGVGRPGERDVARAPVRTAACRKLPVAGSAPAADVGEVLEQHAIEDPLAGRQLVEHDARGEVGGLERRRPGTRRSGLSKRSVVEYSTNIRAARSARLQITARPR